MKATIEFNLDDFADALSHKQALAGREALLALLDLDIALRDAAKYRDDTAAASWRLRLHEILRDRNISLEELLP